ncbi:acyl-CoA N-acyltransferase, partial [Schizophyllum fasciatum]
QARYDLAVARTSDLTVDERVRCWELLQENMKDMYENSSWGWDPEDKYEELFHKDTRFILARRKADDNELIGYAAFRFEVEEGEDVVYLYEVQISNSCRRQGLGRILMEQARRIGEQYKMNRIMLTVFNANVPALKLYESLGFCLDPASPGYVGEDSDSAGDVGEEEAEEADYRILSRSCF